jgi:hypothetical protein
MTIEHVIGEVLLKIGLRVISQHRPHICGPDERKLCVAQNGIGWSQS